MWAMRLRRGALCNQFAVLINFYTTMTGGELAQQQSDSWQWLLLGILASLLSVRCHLHLPLAESTCLDILQLDAFALVKALLAFTNCSRSWLTSMHFKWRMSWIHLFLNLSTTEDSLWALNVRFAIYVL